MNFSFVKNLLLRREDETVPPKHNLPPCDCLVIRLIEQFIPME